MTTPRTREALRRAWEAGFKLCRHYGDNHAHFDGEQKERHWEALLASLPVRPEQQEEKNDDFGLLGSTAGANTSGLTPRRED